MPENISPESWNKAVDSFEPYDLKDLEVMRALAVRLCDHKQYGGSSKRTEEMQVATVLIGQGSAASKCLSINSFR